jgi:hypothetical protein
MDGPVDRLVNGLGKAGFMLLGLRLENGWPISESAVLHSEILLHAGWAAVLTRDRARPGPIESSSS